MSVVTALFFWITLLCRLGLILNSDLVTINTTPDPPTQLSIDVQSSKVAVVSWDPPNNSSFSGFKLKVILISLSEPNKEIKNIQTLDQKSTLKDLTPGATYEIQLYSVYKQKESTAYISTNFTTKPNTPGRFIVWFRNETTLSVLWQPPYPYGYFTDYRVSIKPEDSIQSELYIPRESDPSRPTQAAFNDLVPGRAYNFSVETFSDGQISDPTQAQYRTVPLRPHNVTFDQSSIGTDFFSVRWSAPTDISEFDRYHVAIRTQKKTVVIEKGQPLVARFTENLTPGQTYQVVVKTVSGSVASYPATGNVTTRPLPVSSIREEQEAESTANISTNSTTKPNTPARFIVWFRNETTLLLLLKPPYPADNFTDYKVSIKPEDSIQSELYVPDGGRESQAAFNDLVPGRAYNISVETFSNGQISDPAQARYRTVPLRPHNVTFDQASIGPDFFSVRWSGPTGISEFDSYQVAIGIRRNTPQIIEKGQPLVARFADNLTPGRTYQVVVKTVSGSVASWPATGNVTTRPLPVSSIREEQEAGTGSPVSVLTWQPNSESQQDSYKIDYNLAEFNGDSSSVTVEEPRFSIDKLQPGRNYSIAIRAVSNGMVSQATLYKLAT